MQKSVSRPAADTLAKLEFPIAEPPGPGTVREVANGVYWLRMRLPFALDHINLWLLRDGQSWTAVDTGLSNDETRENWQRVLSGGEITGSLGRIIVTHYHPDHMGNAGWLTRRLNIPMWTSESEYLSAHTNYSDVAGNNARAVAQLFKEHGLDEARVAAIDARGNGYRKIISEPPERYVRLLDGDEIAIGGNTWRVITGYGHAPEHSALYCASLGVLISGDMLLPKISTNVSVWPFEPLGDPLKLFLRSIERFRELPEDTLVLPSHGLPFYGAHLRVGMLRQHHDERLADVRQACKSPRTAADLLPVLFRRELDTHQLFFAMGESIAHLNNLWYRNELERRDGGADGVHRFAPAVQGLTKSP